MVSDKCSIPVLSDCPKLAIVLHRDPSPGSGLEREHVNINFIHNIFIDFSSRPLSSCARYRYRPFRRHLAFGMR